MSGPVRSVHDICLDFEVKILFGLQVDKYFLPVSSSYTLSALKIQQYSSIDLTFETLDVVFFYGKIFGGNLPFCHLKVVE